MTKRTNKAMMPTTARVPEIEQLLASKSLPEEIVNDSGFIGLLRIRGTPKEQKQKLLEVLREQYTNWVKACEQEGISFFDYGRLLLDTSRITPETQDSLERQTIFAASIDVKKQSLVVYHVTDKPKNALDTIYKRRSFIKSSHEHEDLGPGFYASDSPEYWKGRASNRYNAFKKLNAKQRETVVAYIKRTTLARKAYLGTTEKEYLERDLQRYLDTGESNWLDNYFDQPYNISVEALYKELGIKGFDPYIVVLQLQGKFFNYSNKQELKLESREFLNTVADWWAYIHYDGKRIGGALSYYYMLKDFGFSGMFTRSGFSGSPQIVIWKIKCVVGTGLTRLSILNKQRR